MKRLWQGLQELLRGRQRVHPFSGRMVEVAVIAGLTGYLPRREPLRKGPTCDLRNPGWGSWRYKTLKKGGFAWERLHGKSSPRLA